MYGIWITDKKYVELGPFVETPRYLAEIARSLASDPEADAKFGALYGVIDAANNGSATLSPAYVKRLRSQATLALNQLRLSASTGAIDLLIRLSRMSSNANKTSH